MKAEEKSSISPWLWVPTLYFAEGIPYFLVNQISVMLLTRMGVPNGQMALFTSLLYLPWVIKPLWSPFVDIIRTKRWWILAMQILMSLAFALLTIALPHPSAELITSGATPISLFQLMLILFWITAFASATHDIAADGFYMLALTEKKQAFYVGIRSTFYRLSSIFGQGILLFVAGYFELPHRLSPIWYARFSHWFGTDTAEWINELLVKYTGDIPLAWQITLGLTFLIFATMSLWHIFFLPKPETTDTTQPQSAKAIMRNFGQAFLTFFQKPGIVAAILFMLLYRLPEAFLIKMMNPFLVATVDKGGLALSTSQVGLAYGTIGVICLTLGGILGGFAASQWGLRKSIRPMAWAVALPCFVYVYLSACQPTNIWAIAAAVSFDQFGYGFGFTAYMLYLMHFSQGPYKTAHYAICTAFMALSMMLPGMVAGYLQEAIGYRWFFWAVMVFCLVTIAVSERIRRTLPQS